MSSIDLLFPHQRETLAPASMGAQDVVQLPLASSYSALLRLPLSGLAGRTLDRADVASAAILGYN